MLMCMWIVCQTPLYTPISDVTVSWPHPKVHFDITAARWHFEPLKLKKNKKIVTKCSGLWGHDLNTSFCLSVITQLLHFWLTCFHPGHETETQQNNGCPKAEMLWLSPWITFPYLPIISYFRASAVWADFHGINFTFTSSFSQCIET